MKVQVQGLVDNKEGACWGLALNQGERCRGSMLIHEVGALMLFSIPVDVRPL